MAKPTEECMPSADLDQPGVSTNSDQPLLCPLWITRG